MSQEENAQAELRRLRWQCRRGMLELDEILMRFLEQRYPTADRDQQRAFAVLLAMEDPLLNRWLILGEQPEAGMADIVCAVRAGDR